MERFSLDNFTSKKNSTIPSWAQSREQIQMLYLTIVKRVKEIEEIIEQSEPKVVEKLKIKERKIVPAKIADSLSIGRSNIREDREPDLVKFINQENDRLARVWKSRCSQLGVGQRLSKEELEVLVMDRDKELEVLKQKNLHEYFDLAVESEVLDSQRDLQEKYRELHVLYKQEQERSANLELKLKNIIREINSRK